MTFTLVAQLSFLLATECLFAFNVEDDAPLSNDFRDIPNDIAFEETELMFDKEPSTDDQDKNVDNPKGNEYQWEEDEEIGSEVEDGIKESEYNIEIEKPGNHSSTPGVEPMSNSGPTRYPPRPGRKRSPYGGRERKGRDRSSRGGR
ncbi:hypothetical protein ACROYT_G024798 [Oculina patagonica]